MQITFLGAAQEVTGSCFLVETESVRFLVDCGMHQGGREARWRNVAPWTFDPRALDFVLLTHAHIDHSGLLPRLCAHGFRGPIYATPATVDLLEVMLLDSAFIQETEWARAQRKRGQGRGHGQPPRAAPAELAYTVAQAQACLEQLRPVAYDTPLAVHTQVRVQFRDAGHILGSAILELELTERRRTRKLVFSGDLGQPGRPVVRDPTPIESADVLVVESTYGDRQHRPLQETVDELVQVIESTLRRRQGNVIIPAFALGRTQELLALLAELHEQGRLPALQVFVDSPMAGKVTALTLKHARQLDPGTRERLAGPQTAHAGLSVRFTQSVDESMALNQIKAGAVIVAASGMCDAGRIQHHLRHHLGRPECAVVLIGFQAEGTVGRRLVDGAKRVRILGDDVPVRASIHTIGGLSAHADRAALLTWLRQFKAPPRQTFVVHGEAATACGFADELKRTLGWAAQAPLAGQRFEL
ncbi:MBL fold metallo-hydrolase RNA specificity domain-containing protein [Inhella gelatinilytica]|uniref:MBL fold metallo-hydrolase n=1 Tax=Inhella gelatinilytica TaxID=2795030 RepID=A0A931NEW9_9BURK|nr:MBL fold metallo-hydrolase [Inhella gelatinilytica]MBH9553655.1 MBL fold metallo-hydrolase [Inhella gelatinilytica]